MLRASDTSCFCAKAVQQGREDIGEDLDAALEQMTA